MELCSIASGSSGNCIYAGTSSTQLLIDAGISGKRIETGLHSLGLKPEDINGILITHEHSDHIGGLGVIARRYEIPIYATKGTIEAVKAIKTLGEIPEALFREIQTEEPFSIRDITIKPLLVSHDAAEPVAYRLQNGPHSVGVLTDLGCYDEKTIAHFQDVEALLIEANHDVNMLQVGRRYPYALKRRILGDKGHLSNEHCGQLLCKLLHPKLREILLGHLSMENNLPELAFETVRLEILMDPCPYRPEDFNISIAGRDERSALIAV
ncbi:MAG: MBL fold metallo-hydrolase [Lachnospiraceae bacterium]|nr:MBL fold metallo-hydrolase [Lachnospiraceae bacterium]